MREGSGRGYGWVGSDFLSAIAGRVNFSPGRAGSKKSDPWTTLPWTTPDSMGSLQRSQRHILYSWIWLGSKCGMCSFSANSSIRHWGKIKECLLERLNYTPDCTVSSMNFQNFLGRGSPSSMHNNKDFQNDLINGFNNIIVTVILLLGYTGTKCGTGYNAAPEIKNIDRAYLTIYKISVVCKRLLHELFCNFS